jgi:hypothetical protein
MTVLTASALKTDDDGRSTPIIILRPQTFARPFETLDGTWLRAATYARLLTTGWRAGTDGGEDVDSDHLWRASWTTSGELQIQHLGHGAPALDLRHDEDNDIWRHAALTSDHLIAILLTTPGDLLDAQTAIDNEIVAGRFLCAAMPLIHA